MNKALKDFAQQISGYSDSDLMTVSIFDAALFTVSELGFDYLANRIIDELINRDLPVKKTINARRLIENISRTNVESYKRKISMLRYVASVGSITWAFEPADWMNPSARLNEYDLDSDGLQDSIDVNDLLPEGYSWGHGEELLHEKKDGSFEIVYPGKIEIRRILLSENTQADTPQKAEVSFMCDGQEKLRKMALKDLFDSSAIKSLANFGALVNEANSKLLAKFFFDYVSAFRPSIERVHTTRQIGWIGNSYNEFVPFATSYEYDNSEYKDEYSSILHSQGTVNEWASLISKYRDDNHIPFRIILATSFASVLAAPLMYQPFFLYIQGRSQIGKTPLLMIIASAWANPKTTSGYIKELSGSDESIELGAQFYGSLPYCLNESQHRVAQKKNPTIDRLVYLLGDGIPKTRGKGAGGLRSQSSWCNAIILTGEEELTKKSSKLGVRMRVLDLAVTDSIISQNDKETESLCESLSFQYNTAGPEFVKHLIDGGMKEAHDLYDEFRLLIPDNVERRQKHIAATILTADTLLSKWIFKDAMRLKIEDILPYLKIKPKDSEPDPETDLDSETDPVENEEIYLRIQEWLQEQLAEHGNDETDFGKVLPKRGVRPAAYAFKDGILEELINRAGGNINDFLYWANENKKLAAANDAGHKYRRQVSFKEGQRWCYSIAVPPQI